MDSRYLDLSLKTGKLTTNIYSTSFSAGLKCIDKESREAIYSIYAFLRQADEIVDTFHQFNKVELMNQFEQEYYNCFKTGISLNIIINGFVYIVKKYSIPQELVEAFLKSMKSDLTKSEFNTSEIKEYIYGSADVVGLMCLKVVCRDVPHMYDILKENAMSLSSAFQKINFLRDLKNDTQNLSRTYFPSLIDKELDDHNKREIIEDIYKEFSHALQGVKQLPKRARTGIYLAYLFYLDLTNKIYTTPAKIIKDSRIRVSDSRKIWLFVKANLLSFLGKSFMR